MVPPTRRGVLATGGLLAVGTGGVLVSAQIDADEQDEREFETTLEWGGQGSEHAEQDCPGEAGFWHWVLTPGGPTPIEPGAILTVTFADDSEVTVEGGRPGEGEGAMHFEVIKSDGGTVVDAVASFDGGGENVVLTIGHGACIEDEAVDPNVEVTTLDPSDVTGQSATLHGELTDLAGFEEVDVFFEWRAEGDEEFTATERQVLTGSGTFDTGIVDLEAGQRYEYVAVAEANHVRRVGEVVDFETPAPEEPTVATEPATDINAASAGLQGALIDMGDFDEVDVYFEWRVVTDEDWTATESQPLAEPGDFSEEVVGLESAETYEFRAVGEANDSRVFGEIREFEKDPADPEVNTHPATDVNASTATLHGDLTAMGDFETADVSFEWRAQSDEQWNETDRQSLADPEAFSAEIDGLETATDYEFRATAHAGEITVVGEILTFTKEDPKKPPVEDDVEFTGVCYKMKEDKEVKYRVTNDTKHDLKFTWELADDDQGGTITVAAGEAATFWATVVDKKMEAHLYLEGDHIATAEAKSLPRC